MKYSKEKVAECVAWVEENGLMPQACGASIVDFCRAMGITDTTYRRWLQNVEFVDALNRAREYFHDHTVREVTNALVKAARGVDFTKEKREWRALKIVEFDPQTGKKIRESESERPAIVKATKETYYYPPDVDAAKFVLTNMEPEKWKNKRETTLSGDLLVRPVLVKDDDQRSKLENIADLGI